MSSQISARVRWMSAGESPTMPYPEKTRLNCITKAAVDYEAEGIPQYAWLSEADSRYKKITTADMGTDLVPTIENIFASFKLSKLGQFTIPAEEIMQSIVDKDVVPSVTSIPGFILREDGLARWKMGHQLDYLRTMMDGKYPSDDDWKDMKLRAMNFEDSSAAERGTRWHTAIEQTIKGEQVTSLPSNEMTQFMIAIPKILKFIKRHKNADLERGFVHEDGYGGTVDYRYGNMIIDWKTKDKNFFTKKGDVMSSIRSADYPVQLAAYAKGLGIDRPRLVNCFIDVENGDVAFYEYNGYEDATMTWDLLLMLWRSRLAPVHHGKLLTDGT